MGWFGCDGFVEAALIPLAGTPAVFICISFVMERLSTDRDASPTLVCTLPRNVSRKKEKHSLRDRSREHTGHVPKTEK
jgi:hypothetical protein